MRLNSVDFDDNGDPETITVAVTRREAQFVAKALGRLNLDAANEVLPGYYSEVQDIYDCLVGNVFNRYWDDGVDGAVVES